MLLAISDFVRARLLREGYDPDRVRVLRNPGPPADAAAQVPWTGAPSFLFMGRVVAEKGAAVMVEALAVTKTNCLVDIAGSGPDEHRINGLVRKLGLDSRVRAHGWANEDTVKRLVDSSRAVVVPSLWHEPAGMVAIEAAVRGRPTIACAVGGLPEIVVHNATGFLVPPGDIKALADAMDYMSENLDEAARMGDAARERALQLYSLDEHLDGLRNAYCAAVG